MQSSAAEDINALYDEQTGYNEIYIRLPGEKGAADDQNLKNILSFMYYFIDSLLVIHAKKYGCENINDSTRVQCASFDNRQFSLQKLCSKHQLLFHGY